MPGFQDLLFCQGAILLAWSWLLGFYFFFIKSNRHCYYFLAPGIIAINVIYLKDLTGLIIYLLTCLLLIYGTRLKLAKKIRVVFSRLGDISYSLYLFHFPVLIIFRSYSPLISPMTEYIAIVAISFLLDEYYDKSIKSYLYKIYSYFYPLMRFSMLFNSPK